MKKIFVATGKISTLKFIAAKEKIVNDLRLLGSLVTHPSQADLILVLGGDGTMLKAIRRYRVNNIPFCGLNFGHIGFLLNEAKPNALKKIIADQLHYLSVPLLQATYFDQRDKNLGQTFAFNDVYLERASTNTAKIKVQVDKKIHFNPLTADGIIICTPAGSTGYNASAGGVMLPIEANALLLTGICPAIWHNWQSSVISPKSKVTIEAIELNKRPVRLVADGDEIPHAIKAKISISDQFVKMAFITNQDFHKKVLKLQFPKR